MVHIRAVKAILNIELSLTVKALLSLFEERVCCVHEVRIKAYIMERVHNIIIAGPKIPIL